MLSTSGHLHGHPVVLSSASIRPVLVLVGTGESWASFGAFLRLLGLTAGPACAAHSHLWCCSPAELPTPLALLPSGVLCAGNLGGKSAFPAGSSFWLYRPGYCPCCWLCAEQCSVQQEQGGREMRRGRTPWGLLGRAVSLLCWSGLGFLGERKADKTAGLILPQAGTPPRNDVTAGNRMTAV